MQKIDHAAVFACIGGGFTPPVLLALPSSLRLLAFVVLWAGVTFFVVSVFTGHYTRIFHPHVLCISLIAPFALYWPTHMSSKEQCTLAASLGLYFVGMKIFNREYPNPLPKVFGYHELFHICVCGGALFTFWLTESLMERSAC
jgi:hemolysin III